MHAHVSALFVHPLKSAAAVAVDTLPLDELGAINDRRWMLIDENGKFITQRERGTLSLIRTEIIPGALLLHSNDRDSLRVPTPESSEEIARAIVWEAEVPVHDAGDRAARWCSAIIGEHCRLVALARGSARALHPKYAGSVDANGRCVALSDGAPLLIIGEGSLALLNDKLRERGANAVEMDRFRPNIVISGIAPHEEDTWRTIQIGDTLFGVGEPCPRCVITTIEQHTGRRAPQRMGEPGGEPLRTLASYRRQGAGAMFGMNVTNASAGVVLIGDRVTVAELR
jgi:uncharacterized protein YcbX